MHLARINIVYKKIGKCMGGQNAIIHLFWFYCARENRIAKQMVIGNNELRNYCFDETTFAMESDNDMKERSENTMQDLGRSESFFEKIIDWGFDFFILIFVIFVGVSAFDHWRLARSQTQTIMELQAKNDDLRDEKQALEVLIFMIMSTGSDFGKQGPESGDQNLLKSLDGPLLTM
jgi:hypothetical protein